MSLRYFVFIALISFLLMISSTTMLNQLFIKINQFSSEREQNLGKLKQRIRKTYACFKPTFGVVTMPQVLSAVQLFSLPSVLTVADNAAEHYAPKQDSCTRYRDEACSSDSHARSPPLVSYV